LKIDQITIKNFRNLEKITYIPQEQLNILVGDNAQGKTSFLEAVFMLGNTLSFRGSGDRDMIRYGAQQYRVEADYRQQEHMFHVKLEYDGLIGKKYIVLNHKAVNFKSDRLLRFVLFTPDDLTLIKNSPGKRRRFLDVMIRQLSAAYAYHFDAYAQLLRRRNELLKHEQTGEAFQAVNPVFYDCAVKLILQRLQIVALLDRAWQKIMPNLNEDGLSVGLRYALSFPVEGDTINEPMLRSAIAECGAERAALEIKRRMSLIGPHLDDVNIYLDGRPAKIFASQGQQRNMVIGLKLAEIEVYASLREQYPIFLLDEVLSELDEGKRAKLIAHLKRLECQTFLTSVEIGRLDVSGAKVVRLAGGAL
jgi:DNA replication and repair protein RecF